MTSSKPLPQQEMNAKNSITSLTAADNGDAAVAPHVGRGRGLGVLGAEVDEYDGLAQPRVAVGHGSGRKVPERGVFFVSCR